MTSRRSSRYLIPVVLFVLIAASATVHAQFERPRFPSEESVSSVNNGGNGDDGFGSKVAGTWLGEGSFGLDFDCDGIADVPPGPSFSDAHAFGVGGSHIATNPANPNSGNGTWQKTGSRQISARNVTFINVNALVNDIDDVQVQVPTTQLNLIAIISLVVDFDQRFESATTTFGAKIYLPTQDPLDPSEAPLVCTAGGHDSFRKVGATE